jgi:hypothetical protein
MQGEGVEPVNSLTRLAKTARGHRPAKKASWKAGLLSSGPCNHQAEGFPPFYRDCSMTMPL